MAKKRMSSDSKVISDSSDIEDVSLPIKKGSMSVEKYFQLFDPPIHIYTRAALEIKFRGIIKTESEWVESLKEHVEGA